MFGFNSICETPFCTLPVIEVVVVPPVEEAVPKPASYALGPTDFGGTPDGIRKKRELDEAIAAIMRMWMNR